METPAIHRAVQVLTNPATLAGRQQDDTHLGQVRKSSCDSGAGEGGVDTTSYGLDDDEVVRYTDEQGRKLPAIPESMTADVLALVHTLHGHAGVGATLALARDHFHWPTVTRDTRQYVLSCGCRRRKRPNSRRIALLPGRPLEPWDELQMDILKIDTFSFRQQVRSTGSRSSLQVPIRIPSRNQAGSRRGTGPDQVLPDVRGTSRDPL